MGSWRLGPGYTQEEAMSGLCSSEMGAGVDSKKGGRFWVGVLFLGCFEPAWWRGASQSGGEEKAVHSSRYERISICAVFLTFMICATMCVKMGGDFPRARPLDSGDSPEIVVIAIRAFLSLGRFQQARGSW